MKRIATSLAVFLLAAVVVEQRVTAQEPDIIRDQDLKLVNFADLDYPAVAKAARVQGVVVVRAKLGDQGEVISASAISGATPLVADALSNAKKWRFVPSPQKTAIIVYDFRLDEGACHDSSHSLFRLIHWNMASIVSCAAVLK